MPITVNSAPLDKLREAVGQTDTNEVIFQLEPGVTYIVEAIVTSAGTASMEVTTDTNQPAAFTNMSVVQDGTQSQNFVREVTGCSYVGLDIASGTWTTRVRRV